MNNKTLSIVSYFTLIGWLVAFFMSKNKPKDPLVKYHLKQSLGIICIGVVLGVLITVIIRIVPALWMLSYVQFAILALLILGIINAAGEKMKPVPVVGSMFEKDFKFLDK